MVKSNETDDTKVLRIIDVNLNRAREALRVVEEYFRFLSLDETAAGSVKLLRHSLEKIEADVGAEKLVASRDIGADPFAYVNRPEELGRVSSRQVLIANFKRSQEAARVIEEYAKLCSPVSSQRAKELRFSLYDLEKDIMGRQRHE